MVAWRNLGYLSFMPIVPKDTVLYPGIIRNKFVEDDKDYIFTEALGTKVSVYPFLDVLSVWNSTLILASISTRSSQYLQHLCEEFYAWTFYASA